MHPSNFIHTYVTEIKEFLIESDMILQKALLINLQYVSFINFSFSKLNAQKKIKFIISLNSNKKLSKSFKNFILHV